MNGRGSKEKTEGFPPERVLLEKNRKVTFFDKATEKMNKEGIFESEFKTDLQELQIPIYF